MLLECGLGRRIGADWSSGADLLGVLQADRDVIGIGPFDQLDADAQGADRGWGQCIVQLADSGKLSAGRSRQGRWRRRFVDWRHCLLAARSNLPAIVNAAAHHVDDDGRDGDGTRHRRSDGAQGYDYPALIIGPTLAQADITHISNEIPFLDDCVVRNFENNLTLCSHTNYWAALAASGADIIGLSGNHVNDFGRAGARRSLTWYKENNIPIYGSGFTPDEACAPLIWSGSWQHVCLYCGAGVWTRICLGDG